MFPVRCFSCGAVVGRYEIRYEELLEEGKTPTEALDTLKVSRYCCRRMFLGHVNIIDSLLLFPNQKEKEQEQKKKTESKNKF